MLQIGRADKHRRGRRGTWPAHGVVRPHPTDHSAARGVPANRGDGSATIKKIIIIIMCANERRRHRHRRRRNNIFIFFFGFSFFGFSFFRSFFRREYSTRLLLFRYKFIAVRRSRRLHCLRRSVVIAMETRQSPRALFYIPYNDNYYYSFYNIYLHRRLGGGRSRHSLPSPPRKSCLKPAIFCCCPGTPQIST